MIRETRYVFSSNYIVYALVRPKYFRTAMCSYLIVFTFLLLLFSFVDEEIQFLEFPIGAYVMCVVLVVFIWILICVSLFKSKNERKKITDFTVSTTNGVLVAIELLYEHWFSIQIKYERGKERGRVIEREFYSILPGA